MGKRTVCRDMPVVIDSHALDRWGQLCGPVNARKIKTEVQRHLWATLRGQGLPLDRSGQRRSPDKQAFLLTLRQGDERRPGLHAVIKPEATRWVVITFHAGTKMKGGPFMTTKTVKCIKCRQPVMLLDGMGTCMNCNTPGEETFRVYVASGYNNALRIQPLLEQLREWGCVITFDWTKDYGQEPQGEEMARELAQAEADAVQGADLLIACLPGAKGTHTELGIARGTEPSVPVIIHSESKEDFVPEGYYCPFYWGYNVLARICCPLEELPERLWKGGYVLAQSKNSKP